MWDVIVPAALSTAGSFHKRSKLRKIYRRDKAELAAQQDELRYSQAMQRLNQSRDLIARGINPQDPTSSIAGFERSNLSKMQTYDINRLERAKARLKTLYQQDAPSWQNVLTDFGTGAAIGATEKWFGSSSANKGEKGSVG